MSCNSFAAVLSEGSKFCNSCGAATSDKKQRMIEISGEGNAIAAALNLRLRSKIDGVDKKIGVLTERIQSVEAKVGSVESKVVDQGSRLEILEQEMAAFKAAGSAPASPPTDAHVGSNEFPPKGQRRTVVFCFWPDDTPREDIVADLKSFVTDHDLVDPDGFFAPARFCNKGKIKFRSVSKMWQWIKANKGTKFKGDSIWWAIDKPKSERLASKKVTAAVKLVREYLVSQEASLDDEVLKSRVPADYDNSFVMLKPMPTSRAIRVLGFPRGETLWARAANAPDLAGFDWVAALATINATQ